MPRFTINENQAYGSITAGTIFQSGTFADCKILVMKKNSKYEKYLQETGVDSVKKFEIFIFSFKR